MKALAQEHIELHSDGLSIYTDGSKLDDGKVGCGFYVPALNITQAYRLSDFVAVYTSEMTAIKLCAEWALANTTLNINIFGDSLSALESLKLIHSTSRPDLLSDICESLLKFQQSKRLVKFIWIPSHVDIPGNEMADMIAKKALTHAQIDICIGLQYQETKKCINEKINRMWQKQWTDSSTGSFYKNIEPTVSDRIKFHSTPRSRETCLTRLRLGHCWLNACLHKVGCHDTGLCTTCQTQETVEHYILYCVEQNALQKMLQNECKNTNLTYSLTNILTKPECLYILYNWITECNRKL